MAKDTTKIIQALTYLASKQADKTLDNMKAYKLLWLADRYHLRQTGSTITGDSYYAMPFGIVPSDAKCILEGTKTKLKSQKGYCERYLRSIGNHQFKAVSEPDLKVFSDSDQDALDKVLSVYGDYDALALSDMSHQFPEWLFYSELIENADTKSSYKINLEHFFKDAPEEHKGFFDEDKVLLSLTQELYHQYNH